MPSPTRATREPAHLQISVHLSDRNFRVKGTPPFEVAVTRYVPPTSNLSEAVLREFFRGPNEEEHAQGLDLITSGFTGFSSLEIEDGLAHLYLSGPCRSLGATYTIAQPLLANLRQFEEIKYVKICDSEGTTEEPTGPTNSVPLCLEP